MKRIKNILTVILFMVCLIPSVVFATEANPLKMDGLKVNLEQLNPKKTKLILGVKDSDVEMNTRWSAEANFIDITTAQGKKLKWNDVKHQLKVFGTVDTKQVGEYIVTYSYEDTIELVNVNVISTPRETEQLESNREEEPLTITKIVLKDNVIQLGSFWKPEDNFAYAEDNYGHRLNWKAVGLVILVTGKMDTQKTGEYKVTYTIGDVSSTSTTVVEASPIELILKSSQIELGDKWSPENNFVKVLLSDGSLLKWQDISKDINIEGEVDNRKTGTYEIIYTYEGLKAIATVKVEKKSEPVSSEKSSVKEIVVKDSLISVGDNWQAMDNFDYVLRTNGDKEDWATVSSGMVVEGDVDSSIAGSYTVEYRYDGISAQATVVVKEPNIEKRQVTVKDTTISKGSNWQAEDNFDFILVNNKETLYWDDVKSEIKVTGDVDTTKVGTYKVSYLYEGSIGIATIMVKEDSHVVAGKTPSTSNGNKTLPQTSETPEIYLLGIGLIVLTVLGLLVMTEKVSRFR